MGFEEAVLAEDAFVADEELGAAAVGEDPDAGHVADLEEHFEDEGDVVGAGDGDVVVGLADELVLGVAEEFAESGETSTNLRRELTTVTYSGWTRAEWSRAGAENV